MLISVGNLAQTLVLAAASSMQVDRLAISSGLHLSIWHMWRDHHVNPSISYRLTVIAELVIIIPGTIRSAETTSSDHCSALEWSSCSIFQILLRAVLIVSRLPR